MSAPPPPPPPPYRFAWQAEFSNPSLNALHAEAFDHALLDYDWLAQVRGHSLGWVCAFDADTLIGFVNVAWDGDDRSPPRLAPCPAPPDPAGSGATRLHAGSYRNLTFRNEHPEHVS